MMQHMVPSGFKRIRHYGLLAPAAKGRRMASARGLQGMPAVNPSVTEEVCAFMQRVAGIDIERCANCSNGCWRVVAGQGPRRRTEVAPSDDNAASTLATCKGPP